MPGDQRKHRLPFVRHPPAEDRGHGSLAVEIDHQNAVAVQGGRHGQMRGGRGLADTALEIRHRHDLGGQVLGPVGQVLLGAGAFSGEMRAQSQHLVQGEPFCPGFRLASALGQIGVQLQHAAEMRGGDRNEIASDFPG